LLLIPLISFSSQKLPCLLSYPIQLFRILTLLLLCTVEHIKLSWFSSQSLILHPNHWFLIPHFLAYYPNQLFLILTLLLVCIISNSLDSHPTHWFLIPLTGSSSHSLVPHPAHWFLILHSPASHLFLLFLIPHSLLLIPTRILVHAFGAEFSTSQFFCYSSRVLLLRILYLLLCIPHFLLLILSCLALHPIFSLSSSLTLLFLIPVLFFITLCSHTPVIAVFILVCLF
jgi:hypothetical protein